MTSIQAVAHSAQHALLPIAPDKLKHSHVYELLAAAFGFRSWAAMRADHVFVDVGLEGTPTPKPPLIAGRSLQLGFTQDESERLASLVLQAIKESTLNVLSLTQLDSALTFVPTQDEDECDEEDWEDEHEEVEDPSLLKELFKQSQLLLSQLEQRASTGDAKSHHRLALLLECKVPTDYLYQESLRGRILNAQEQIWVDNYLQMVPRFERFLKHLKAAADGGIRAAALSYSIAVNDSAYRLLAESMEGDIDPIAMAETAKNAKERQKWLWVAAKEGDIEALETLAGLRDQTAMEQVAALGNPRWLQILVDEALEQGDGISAWKWHLIALGHGIDMTQSTLHAFHDGGINDGQSYDSDFGGPLAVGGDEGIALPAISEAEKETALAQAQQLVERVNR